MAAYTNTRHSKVSVAGLDFVPGQTHEIEDEKHVLALEAKGKDGGLLHPLRKGASPILQAGRVAMPAAAPVVLVNTLDGLDDVRAMAQVRLCSSLDTLAGWHAAEKRPGILAAIEQRGKEIAKV